MPRWWQRLSPFDRKLVLVAVGAVALSFGLLSGGDPGQRLVVRSADRVVFVAPLSKDQLLEFSGPLGETQVEVHDGGARVISSPCRQQICVRMGVARRSGDLIACVPNRLVLQIAGDQTADERAYDLISR